MKKRLSVFVAAVAALALGGCGSVSSSETSSQASASSQASSSQASSSVSYAPISEIDPPTYEEESVQIHYLRPDGKYSAWALWIWPQGGDGSLYGFNGQEQTNGAIASYKLSEFGVSGTGTLGFIVRNSGDPATWSDKDPDGDRFAKLANYPADSHLVHHIYLRTGDSNVYYSPDYKILDAIDSAYFTSYSKLYFEASNKISAYQILKGEDVIKDVTLASPTKGVLVGLDAEVDLSYDYRVKATFAESGETITKSVSVTKLYGTDKFGEAFTYDGNDLGASYSESKTTFKVWSPFASAIELRLYDNGTPTRISATKGSDVYVPYPMSKGEKGVWEAEVSGDQAGKYYTYAVTNGNYLAKEIVDPYAKSAGIDGLRGMVVDFDATDPEGWEAVKPLQIDRKGLVVYETHVCDLTSSPTWTSDVSARAKEKTFEGAYLSGTTFTKGETTVKTGFDHVKELGVNAVELLPIFDQANDEVNPSFNWGYNPLNYNVLEGSYSSDPYDGYARVREFKALVKAYHDGGMNIIMDVVYNHVNGASGSNWDVLVPGYFYRYEDDGSLYNGSGCGNEVASELPMVHKFILDSTAFWAHEYKLGGFRFDLMALIDMKTMNAVADSLHASNPDCVVYGEPWTGGDSGLAGKEQTSQANITSWGDYGGFNDQMRDALIAGGLNSKESKAWVTDTASGKPTEKILGGIRGQTLAGKNMLDPNKTVNYASCHDNYTLYDRVSAAGITDQTALHFMPVLANSVVLTSSGTSFMLAGEEMLRTKGGNSNSYNASYEVNALDYSRKADYPDVFESYRKLVAFKTGVDGLRLEKAGTLSSAFPIEVSALGNQISYEVKDTANSKTYRVVHNNGYGDLPTMDLSGFSVYLDTRGAHSGALDSGTSFLPFETLIAVK
ncbi:MAG: type I pullulanase [Bacilli bacterium]|jgi:pullulanase|nr:type I pullulanase [Bacilli bacterium]